MISKKLTTPFIPPPKHTHYNEKRTKTSTLGCKKQIEKSKILHHKNAKNSKNRLAPVKIESKKQDKLVCCGHHKTFFYVNVIH